VPFTSTLIDTEEHRTHGRYSTIKTNHSTFHTLKNRFTKLASPALIEISRFLAIEWMSWMYRVLSSIVCQCCRHIIIVVRSICISHCINPINQAICCCCFFNYFYIILNVCRCRRVANTLQTQNKEKIKTSKTVATLSAAACVDCTFLLNILLNCD